MRRKLLVSTEDVRISVADAVACDVVFYNPKEDGLIIRREQKYWKKNETPIGIVVIPASHGVLKDGSGIVNQCGVMSIVAMGYNTPEAGDVVNRDMAFGGYGVDIGGKSDNLERYDSIDNGLLNYKHIATTFENTTNNVDGYSADAYAYLPRQHKVGENPMRTSSPYAPSPYIGSDYKSGGYNESYGLKDGVVVTEINNALSDFKGIVNTKIITDLATGESWKTISSLSNNTNAGYYPAACCCARYKTTGTKAFKDCTTEELRNGSGFWYLPAIGELGYIVPKIKDIDDIINKLKNTYNIGVPLGGDRFFASSEYDYYSTYAIDLANYRVGDCTKKSGTSVRAFLRLNAEPEVVDTGLSVDWATCNLGATKPEEYGYYFQWGGLIPYNSDRTPVGGGDAIRFGYNSDCPYWVSGTSASNTKWSKYTSDSYSSTGVADNKTILEPEDDAAHVHWGGDWRMPTEAEFNELFNACNIAWVTDYNNSGINGCLFTLKSNPSKTLFFPASGFLSEEDWRANGLQGDYISSSINKYQPFSAQTLIFFSGDCYVDGDYRYYGKSIRAVKPKNK